LAEVVADGPPFKEMKVKMERAAKPAQGPAMLRTLVASAIVAGLFSAAPAFSQDAAPISQNPTAQQAAQVKPLPPGDGGTPPGEGGGVRADPLEPFNSAMFTFNLKLDDWVLHPVASGYAFIAPEPVRKSVGNFFNNVDVIPRFANNLFQLKLAEAGVEVARFGINSTVGVAGFFDPAEAWFGLKQHDNDFGLTLRYWGAPTGPYVMLPFLGPSTVGDTVGKFADGAMNPMDYLLPWYVYIPANAGWRIGEAVNYRSMHLNQFEEADRYAIDLYGAVQDAYLQDRDNQVKKLHEEEW
jgi:phospholipid-binding lipoprotein MlaA